MFWVDLKYWASKIPKRMRSEQTQPFKCHNFSYSWNVFLYETLHIHLGPYKQHIYDTNQFLSKMSDSKVSTGDHRSLCKRLILFWGFQFDYTTTEHPKCIPSDSGECFLAAFLFSSNKVFLINQADHRADRVPSVTVQRASRLQQGGHF